MGKWTKRFLIFSFGFFILMVVIVIISPAPEKKQLSGENDSKTTQSKPKDTTNKQPIKAQAINEKEDIQAVVKPEFAFTVDQYISRLNQTLKNMDAGINFSNIKDEEKDNGEYLTLQAKANKKTLGAVLTANNNTRALQSIMLLGSGDGTQQSGFDLILGATAVVAAVENPNMKVTERGNILKNLGFANGLLKLDGETIKFSRKDINYSISLSSSIGMMLTAEPVNK